MSKKKSKVTLNISIFLKIYLKWSSHEKFFVFKCQKNRRNFLTKKGKEQLLF